MVAAQLLAIKINWLDLTWDQSLSFTDLQDFISF